MQELIKIAARYAIIIPVLLAIIAFITIKDKRTRIDFAILVVAGGILSLLLAKIGGHLINDPRPFVVGHFTPLLPHANDNGFPSDHTLLASFLGFAIMPYSKKLGLPALTIAISIGIARMAAGIHHLEDIIGSFVITGGAALVVLAVLEIIRVRQQRAES